MRRWLPWLVILALTALAWRSHSLLLHVALPIIVTAAIGFAFAHSLGRGRTPLIARAIARIDGAQWLADAAIARYARRLTWIWAIHLFMLAAILATATALTYFADAVGPRLPSPARLGAIGVPLAIAALLLGEFYLRPVLLPQAPRHGLYAFLRGLIVNWPQLLDERAFARAQQDGDMTVDRNGEKTGARRS
jgi:uncharacterized membrane protein